MATNRYGQIWHGDHHHINIRFPSTEARLKFQNEFEAYHASHDHEGDIPTFRSVTSKDLKLGTGSRSPQDLVKAETNKDYRITLDGYSWSEIQEYHNPSEFRDYFWYHVPTCCVPPIIVVDHEFVDSDTLQRHPLSSIFGDMPADDFQSLIDSVQTDGFIDPIIRIHEGQILDGWHRYRAAQELNLIRRLKFQEWDEDEHRDGDPKTFVLARNIERRHLSASQRAQITVAFNERFGHGGDRGKMQDCNLKTQQDLADQANVSKRTIATAVQVEKAGQSEAVIAGEKTASEVLLQEERDRAQQAEIEMWNAFDKSELSKYLDKDDLLEVVHKELGFLMLIDPANMKKPHMWHSRFNDVKAAIEEEHDWVKALLLEFSEDTSESDIGDFDKDCRKRPSKIRDALPQWQKDVGDHHIPDSVKDAVRSADPMRVVQGAQRMGKVKDINDVSAAEIGAIVRLMERAELTLYFCVHDVQFEFEKMSGADNADENLPLQDALDEMKAEDTYEQKQQEHVNRLEALPGEIRSYFPTWQQEHGIEGNLTLKRLLNARSHIEFGRERGGDPFFKEEMEDLLQRMKSNDEDLVEKVREKILSHHDDLQRSRDKALAPATRNLLGPDDPNNIKVCFRLSYPKANGFSHQVFCEELFELPRTFATDEIDIEKRDAAFAKAFAVLKAELGVSEKC